MFLFAETNSVLVEIVTLVLAFLSMVFVAVMAYFTAKMKQEVQEVVVHTNSMKDELVEEVRKAANLQGRSEAREERERPTERPDE